MSWRVQIVPSLVLKGKLAERVTQLARRLQEIEDELDLTKNQASAQLDAEAAPEPRGVEAKPNGLQESCDGVWL